MSSVGAGEDDEVGGYHEVRCGRKAATGLVHTAALGGRQREGL